MEGLVIGIIIGLCSLIWFKLLLIWLKLKDVSRLLERIIMPLENINCYSIIISDKLGADKEWKKQ